MDEETYRICPNCGARLATPEDWELCPNCGHPCAPPVSTRPPPGTTRIGKYEVLDVLGRGGSGTVLLALDPTLGCKVALKLLNDGPDASTRSGQRLRDEAERARSLEHPNIVPIFEVGEHRGEVFFAMRYLPRCLANEVRTYKGHPWNAAELLLPIAEAVNYGHQRAIVHCDIKPGNILLDHDGRPYVSDFGVSRRVEVGQPSAALEGPGTPGYMAPEQAGGPGGIAFATDVWGLGAVLYHLVCGQTPFPAERTPEAIERLKHHPHPKPTFWVPELDPNFVAILDRCLRKHPQDRYASTKELADDLKLWLRDQPVRTRASAVHERALRWTQRHPTLSGVMGASICFFTVLVGNYLLEAPALERKVREEVLTANVWAARAHEVAVQATLKDLTALVAQAALGAEAVEGTAADRWRPVEAILQRDGQRRFDSFLMLDPSGRLIARSPAPPAGNELNLNHRSYVTCARERALNGDRRVCVTGAYRSRIDKAFRFALAAPVLLGDPARPEIVVATISTDSMLTSLLPKPPPGPRPSADDAGLTVSLVARRDEGPSSTPSEIWLLLQHQALPPGTSNVVTSKVLDRFVTSAVEDGVDDAYDDPLLRGRWLAGFARVKGTPWAVIVQSREGAALAPNHRLRDRLLLSAKLALGTGLLLSLVAALLVRLRGGRRRLFVRERSGQGASPP